jgi:hypothetical protein
MADISAFPTLTDVLYTGANVQSMNANTAVTAGQVVAIDATGVSMTVDPAVAEAGSFAVGVAIADADAGSKVSVAMVGCIVKVVNADDTTGIDAGDLLVQNDNAVGGTVSTAGAAATTFAVALEDIAGGSYGLALVQPGQTAAGA